MAQTGYSVLSLYYSSTATNVPTAGNLVAGELAINTADGKLFYKDSAGVVQVIGTKGGVGSSTTTQVLYNSSGLVVGSANMTFSGTALTLANDASISGLTVGKGGGALGANTVLGVSALAANTTGNAGVAIGYGAVGANTTGTGNIGIGYLAINSGNGGSYNTAVGTQALVATTASYNSAYGYQSLFANTSGTDNNSFGRGSLIANTTGSNNVAVGSQSLNSNTTASNNTAVGYQAGYGATTGAYNTLVGGGAGYALNSNGNTIVGYQAGYSLTSGVGNTFVGANSPTGVQACGYYVTTGSNNTILGGYDGNQGGLDIRTSSNYIVLSDGAGNLRQIINGSGDVGIGANPGTINSEGFTLLRPNAWTSVIKNSHNVSGDLLTYGVLGANCSNTSSFFLNLAIDTVGTKFYVYGNGDVKNATGVYGTISDAKLKENIVDATPKLDKVMQLQVRNFNFKNDTSLKQIGFVAQEFEQVFPSLVDETPETDGEGKLTGDNIKGVKTSVLVPILVKAIQELKAEVDSLKQQLGK